jgi:hypothetical protein
MPVAAAIPLIAAGVSGLFSLFGGKQQSNATKAAANIQAASSDKALAEARRIFDLQRSDRQPYVDQSLKSLGQLGQLSNMGSYMQLPAQRLGASSPGSMPMSQMNMGALGQPAQPQGAPAQGQQPMGMFRAPDGETRQFPLAMEQQLVAKGVQRVS